MKTPETIIIPYRAGGLIAFRIDDEQTVTNLWIEVCLDPTGHIWRYDGTQINAETNQWTAFVPSTFSADRYDQEWLVMVCVATATTPADVLGVLPIKFGIDNNY